MTISIEIPGASFTKFIAQTKLPYLALARAFYLFGTDQASSTKNLATSAYPTASIIGTPLYNTGYCELSSLTDGFAGGFSADGSFTHIIVATIPTSGNCAYMGNWGGGSTRNALYQEVGNTICAIDGNNRATLNYNQGTSFAFLAATYDGTTAKVYAHNGSSLQTASGAFTGGTGVGPFRVGGSGSYSGNKFKAAAAANFAQALTASQLLEQYAFLKPLVATRGVAML